MSNLILEVNTVIVVCLFAGNAIAQELGKLTTLPDKLPPSVEARVGKVEFNRGLPTQKGIEQLFEIQDFQRAVQLYQWAIPAIGVMGWHGASIANGKACASRPIRRWSNSGRCRSTTSIRTKQTSAPRLGMSSLRCKADI